MSGSFETCSSMPRGKKTEGFEASDMAKLAVVIVNRDAKPFLRECLRSVFGETRGLSLDVYVVDNASADGSPDMVREEFPAVRLIQSGSSLGFAAANNIALRLFLEGGEWDYVLLLNSDAVILDRALERMNDYLERHPDVGVVGPALVLPDGSFQTGTGGWLPSAWTGFNYFFFLHKLFPRTSASIFLDQRAFSLDRKSGEAGTSVEWLSGACLLLRREVLQKIGLLDEGYYFYGEDIDWGRRMTNMGIRLRYLPSVRVRHYQGVSFGSRRGVNTLWLRMLYKYVERERGRGEYLLFRLFSVAGFSLRLVLYSLACLLKMGPGRRKIREAVGFLAFGLFAPAPASTRR